jgi:hypothetical protein
MKGVDLQPRSWCAPYMPKREKEESPKIWDNMNENERAYLIKEVFGGGFGSELVVREAFNQAGFESQADFFHDKDAVSAGGKGGNAREYDVRAHLRRGELREGDFRYYVIGEVKKDFTWVLGDEWEPEKFDADGAITSVHPGWLTNHYAHNRGDGDGPGARGGPDVGAVSQALAGLDLLPSRVSTSLHEHTGGEAPAWYGAAVKVLKACEGFKPPPIRIRRNYHSLAENAISLIPMLILDGNLMAVVRNTGGSFDLEPRPHAMLRFSFGSPNYEDKVRFIHLVTPQGLPEFLRRVQDVELRVSEVAHRMFRSDPGFPELIP